MKKLIWVLVFISLTSVLVYSGGQSEGAATPEEKVEINVLHSKDNIADAMAKLESAFEAKYPQYDLVPEMLMGNEYDTVLYARDAAGERPDLFTIFNIGEVEVSRWAGSGKVAAVNDLKVVKQLPAHVRDSVTLTDGNVYAVLNSNTAAGIVYNKALFAEAGITEVPRTLSEMIDAVEKLNAKGITPFVAGGKDGWTLGNQIWKVGLESIFPYEWNEKRQNNEASFHDYGMDMFGFIDLFIDNTQKNPLDADYTTQLATFAAGDGAMICQGLWVYGSIVDMNPELKDQIGIFPIPFSEDKDNNGLYTFQEMAWLISNDADLDAVDAYFDFMINDPVGRKIFAEDFAVMNPFGIEFTADPLTAEAMDYMAKGEFVFNYHENSFPSEFFMVHATSMQEYVGGMISKTELLDRMDEKWLEITAK